MYVKSKWFIIFFLTWTFPFPSARCCIESQNTFYSSTKTVLVHFKVLGSRSDWHILLCASLIGLTHCLRFAIILSQSFSLVFVHHILRKKGKSNHLERTWGDQRYEMVVSFDNSLFLQLLFLSTKAKLVCYCGKKAVMVIRNIMLKTLQIL